jgi:hypothetical protein
MYKKTFQWSAITILLSIALLTGGVAVAQNAACCKALSAAQLRDQWEDNELNWRSTYRGKEVTVIGTVRDIDHSWTRGRKGSTVFLQDDQTVDWVIKAGFKSTERVTLEDIKVGTKVAIKGTARKPKVTLGGRTHSITTMGLMNCVLVCDGKVKPACAKCTTAKAGCPKCAAGEKCTKCAAAKAGCPKCTAGQKCAKCEAAQPVCTKCTADMKCEKCSQK